MELEDNLRLSLLSEIYKNLLTQKQQKMLKDFLDNNLSISELATEYKTSRQAVNDLLKRTFKSLEIYEKKLQFLKNFEKIKLKIEEIADNIGKISISNQEKQEIIRKLNSILEVM